MAYSFGILTVDDEEDLCRIISHKLKKSGFRTFQAITGDAALQIVKEEDIDVVILDYMLPDLTGLEVLQKIKNEFPHVEVIMLTAYGNVENAVDAMRLGAFDYLNKPSELELIKEIVGKACDKKRLQLENQVLKEQLASTSDHEELVFQSEKMKGVCELFNKVKETDASILILGESGVGKTALSKWIHKISQRKDKPFVSINCAAIPDSLLESELFGYQKGAFTGATESRAGKFEAADGGTIFLDEVGEMPLAMQAKMLHIIEEKTFMKLGSNSYRSVDVRIITATNKDIKKLVKEGQFRQDLYYRLNLVEIEVPPLRERREDIPYMIINYIHKLNHKYGKQVQLSDETIAMLTAHDWPGNIRELLNMLERMHIVHSSGMIHLHEVSGELFFPQHVETELVGTRKMKSGQLNLQKALEEVEEEIISRALEEVGGNQTKAADLLGISRHTLIYKMKKMR
ncbi:sigma-54-dependent transcriptional regulator [Paenibacillus radicis (ex Xue et al. 2023)]|uniref:Sigma-54 dependent transcriptional regulator n=1 Tax=Paenibacillus radicis (ex Xue et al. 2023) TaxID=2972489 RepID=A0ABT1YGZ7_9BACL|nr:sigma-54 dependent transcriptional regulator [Paenibacillus radicis (ex Xue et al. 2023)]MCR8632470.1 sigma-54 dependent transcriptional regulator [Paenibacillus radicis (ex Xue et al. 2023)]